MRFDQPVRQFYPAQLKTRVMTVSALERARGLALIFAVVTAMGVIVPIMVRDESMATRLDGALAALALSVYWVIGYKRKRFPVTGELPEAVGVYLVLRAASGHPFLPLGGLIFRSLYGTTPLALARWAGWSAAVLAAASFEGAKAVESDIPRVLAVAIVPIVMPGLRSVLTRLEATEQRLGSLIEHSTDVVTILGEDLRVTWQAQSIRAVLGYEVSDWLGSPFSEHVHPEDRAKLAEFVIKARNQPDFSRMLELRLRDAEGQVRWFEIAASNRLHDPNVRGYVLNIRDATDRRRLESERRTRELVQQRSATQRVEIERLRERMESEREKRQLQERLQHAQRLESIGSLASGVAHDFNNLLAIIVNYVNFVRDELPEGSEAQDDVDQIARAAERGARLTEQLLAFGQRKVGETEVLDVGEVIAGMQTMLSRPLGSKIELRYERSENVCRVEADRTDIEQIVLNLVVNARDALTDGGAIEVVAENADVDEGEGLALDIDPGRYLRVSVIDDGCGIDEQTLAHVCEPFFTTKPPGEGSGLGLATVFGIARQAGGCVAISSEVGVGTRVDVYLPAADRRPEAPKHRQARGAPAVGGGRILLIEEESAVRDVVRRILERADYEVAITSGGEEALELLAADNAFDLMLTDVIMPGMWGDELATRAREVIPDLPTLFMSGYGERFLRRGRAPAPGPVLTKPFREETLLSQVADLIGARHTTNGDGPQSDRLSAENQNRSNGAVGSAQGAQIRSST